MSDELERYRSTCERALNWHGNRTAAVASVQLAIVGYIQVAKAIDFGLLLLIQKGSSISKLSGDFQEIVRLKKLPMDWRIDLKHLNEIHHFKTGIISFMPDNGVDWLDTKDIHGISSFEELAENLKN